MADKTIKARIQLRNADLSAFEAGGSLASTPFSAGEMVLARLSGDLSSSYKVKIGDGSKTWAELPDGGNIIIPAANVEGLTEAIAALSTSYYDCTDISELSTAELLSTYVEGDIAVEKKDIAGGKQEYCAYRFSKEDKTWRALDGNYSAENVYFKDNITLAGDYGTTGRVGNVKLTDGTLLAQGKSVKDVFQTIFTQEINAAIVTHPSWSFTGSSNLTGEVGLTYNPSSATATFSSRGTYNYQPTDTGVRVPVNNMTVKRTTATFTAELSNGTELDQGGTVVLPAWSTAQTYTHVKVQYDYEAYAYHTEGLSAKSNLGNVQNVKIAANDWSNSTAASACKKTATITYQGYYPSYYGKSDTDIVSNPENITSADIVTYAGGLVAAKGKFSKEVRTLERPADQTSYTTYTAKQWYWIAPVGKISSVYARQNNPAAPLGTVKKKATNIYLPTSNGFGDVEYEVWYVNNDYAQSNGYAWKLNGTF